MDILASYLFKNKFSNENDILDFGEKSLKIIDEKKDLNLYKGIQTIILNINLSI
jgi:hypothetical protein